MGIINIGQADNVIEENQAGDIVANLDVVNAGSVSATSVDTEDLLVGLSDGEVSDPAIQRDTSTLVHQYDGSAVEVGTSDTTIVDSSENAGFAVVIGREQGGSNRFVDLVLYTYFDTSTVVGSATGGSPATRSYTPTQGPLVLKMSSGTYDVIVHHLMGDR